MDWSRSRRSRVSGGRVVGHGRRGGRSRDNTVAKQHTLARLVRHRTHDTLLLLLGSLIRIGTLEEFRSHFLC